MNSSCSLIDELISFLNRRYKADLRVFSSESYKQLTYSIKEWLEKESPSPAIFEALVKFENRGKLCGYPFTKGDIIYRCRYIDPLFKLI